MRRPGGRSVAVALTAAVLLGGCGGLAGQGSDRSTGPSTVPSATGTASTDAPLTPTSSASVPLPTTSSPASQPAMTSTASAPAAPSPSSTTPPSPSPSSTTPPPPTPTVPSLPAATATPPQRTTLLLGDRGPAVLALQERLSELGYWLGTPDGTFGGLTQQAVFALQKAAGIGRDGIVGPKTEAALEAGARPVSRVGGTGVEIDLDRQLLLVVRDGAVTRILNTSTGNGEKYVSGGTTKIARTPTGSFAVYREVDALEVAELGELYRPKYFYKGYAVHGSPSVPPYPASHGCARLTNAAITMIWDRGYLEVGTPVTVY